MLPRLQAEEALGRIQEMQAAMPEYQEHDRRRIIERLEALAQMGNADNGPEALLAEMGIVVE